MSGSIESIPVMNGSEDAFKTRWGSTVNDYRLNGDFTAFEDLMVAISEQRARAIEDEIIPMMTRMRKRNEQLDKLGSVLSELTKIQSTFESDMEGDEDMRGWITYSNGVILQGYCSELGIGFRVYQDWDDVPSDRDERSDFYRCESEGRGYSGKKKCIDAFAEKVKNVIDGLNNESQSDMTRLQALVQHRDEAYSTGTTLLSSVSETKDNAIGNM